jgi:hypothetical protein
MVLGCTVLAFSLCGCGTLPLTTRTVEAAKGETTESPLAPGLFLLVPLTAPMDLIYYTSMHWSMNWDSQVYIH